MKDDGVPDATGGPLSGYGWAKADTAAGRELRRKLVHIRHPAPCVPVTGNWSSTWLRKLKPSVRWVADDAFRGINARGQGQAVPVVGTPVVSVKFIPAFPTIHHDLLDC